MIININSKSRDVSPITLSKQKNSISLQFKNIKNKRNLDSTQINLQEKQIQQIPIYNQNPMFQDKHFISPLHGLKIENSNRHISDQFIPSQNQHNQKNYKQNIKKSQEKLQEFYSFVQNPVSEQLDQTQDAINLQVKSKLNLPLINKEKSEYLIKHRLKQQKIRLDNGKSSDHVDVDQLESMTNQLQRNLSNDFTKNSYKVRMFMQNSVNKNIQNIKKLRKQEIQNNIEGSNKDQSPYNQQNSQNIFCIQDDKQNPITRKSKSKSINILDKIQKMMFKKNDDQQSEVLLNRNLINHKFFDDSIQQDEIEQVDLIQDKKYIYQRQTQNIYDSNLNLQKNKSHTPNKSASLIVSEQDDQYNFKQIFPWQYKKYHRKQEFIRPKRYQEYCMQNENSRDQSREKMRNTRFMLKYYDQKYLNQSQQNIQQKVKQTNKLNLPIKNNEDQDQEQEFLSENSKQDNQLYLKFNHLEGWRQQELDETFFQ